MVFKVKAVERKVPFGKGRETFRQQGRSGV